MAAKKKEDLLQKHAKVYELLKKVRASKTVSLKPTSMLRSEIVGIDGKVQPFKLRYYQVQAIFHLMSMKRMVLGDATGTGKTLCVIASLCYTWQKEPLNKVVVVAPKSALTQWEEEIYKFTTGIKVYLADGTPEKRKKIYQEFVNHDPSEDKAILILGYSPLVRDWSKGAVKPDKKKKVAVAGLLEGLLSGIEGLTVIYDEAAAFKSDRTKTWQVCRHLSDAANRCYGLTATLLKNRLMEGFCIFKVIYPGVFTNKTQFMKAFCKTKMLHVGGGRQIPQVVGYINLDKFREQIDPFYLGRHKHEISDELPTLITREVKVELSKAEDAKYEEALTGILCLGDGEVKDYEEHKKLVALIYCQKVVDSLSLLKYSEGDLIEDYITDEASEVKVGSKEQALMDLLQEEYDGENIIVYVRMASLIPRLQGMCDKAGIQNVSVTGKVVGKDRKKAMKRFQDPEDEVRVIFISDAGSEAINLQTASVMVFYDSPWSWGNYIQLLGRPIRIGSPHQHVVAIHLVAERPAKTKKGRATIDRYTLDILNSKKDFIDQVLGEAAVGALDFESGGSFNTELMRALRSGVED